MEGATASPTGMADSGPALSGGPGVVAGVVIGAVVGVMILLLVCSFALTWCARNRRVRAMKLDSPLSKRGLRRDGIFVVDASGNKVLTLPPAGLKISPESGGRSYRQFKDRLAVEFPNAEWEAFDCLSPSKEPVRAWISTLTDEVRIQTFDAHKRRKNVRLRRHGSFIVDRHGHRVARAPKSTEEPRKPLERTASFNNFSALLPGAESSWDVHEENGSRFWINRETDEVVQEDPNAPMSVAGMADDFKAALVKTLGSPSKKDRRRRRGPGGGAAAGAGAVDAAKTTRRRKKKKKKAKDSVRLKREGSFIVNIDRDERLARVPKPQPLDASSSTITALVPADSPMLSRTNSFQSFLQTLEAPANWEAFKDKSTGVRYWVNVRTNEVRYQDPHNVLGLVSETDEEEAEDDEDDVSEIEKV